MAARNKDESRVSKRYRFYSLAMAEKFDNKVFDHKGHPEYNIYMMLRKTEIEAGHITDPDVIGFISEQYVLE